eukprot:5690391-Amphidinium_carterae.1
MTIRCKLLTSQGNSALETQPFICNRFYVEHARKYRVHFCPCVLVCVLTHAIAGLEGHLFLEASLVSSVHQPILKAAWSHNLPAWSFLSSTVDLVSELTHLRTRDVDNPLAVWGPSNGHVRQQLTYGYHAMLNGLSSFSRK